MKNKYKNKINKNETCMLYSPHGKHNPTNHSLTSEELWCTQLRWRSCISFCAQSSHPPHWPPSFCIRHDCTTCPLEKSITRHDWVSQSNCDSFTNVHKSTYWRRNRLMHRHGCIHWTHPDSFGIFTKLNTSMCAADCSQGYKFTICFTPHPCSHSLLQR